MNTTGEPVFDGALKVALAVALEQSPFLKVFPDDAGARDAAADAASTLNERVTRTIAREIAQREQLKALVAGSIGEPRQPLRARARSDQRRDRRRHGAGAGRGAAQGRCLTALGKAAKNLREKLGESLASVQRFDVPLPRATTASLEALHAYSLALDQGREVAAPRGDSAPEAGDRARSRISRWRRRCSRASTPTPAARRKRRRSRAGVRAARSGQRARAVLHLVALLPRRGAGLGQGARRWRTSWTATYPREAFAFNSLGLASAAFGQHDEAVRAFREAIRLDPRFVPPHGNLAGSLIASRPVRRSEGGPARRGRAGRRLHQPAADVALAGVSRRRSHGPGPRARSAFERADSGCWAAMWEARASRVRRTVGGGARALPARHPDGDARRLPRARRRSGRWKTPKPTRSPASAPTRGARSPAALALEPRQLHARAGEPGARAVRTAPRSRSG